MPGHSNTLHGSIFISWSNVSLVNLPISCFMRDVDIVRLCLLVFLALEEPPKVEITLFRFRGFILGGDCVSVVAGLNKKSGTDKSYSFIP